MKSRQKTIPLTYHGIDEASEQLQLWLKETGVQRRDILRTRLTVEELLGVLCAHGTEPEAELTLTGRLGRYTLRICYGGGKFDPTQIDQNELEEFSAEIMARSGLTPQWRWYGGRNELLLPIPSVGISSELVMLGSIALALAVGLLGSGLSEGVRTAVSDYALSYLSDCFLKLLNTFMGPMIFLSIVNGITGIGNAAAFGRIGRLMLTRFVVLSFVMSGAMAVVLRALFHLSEGGGAGAAGVKTILDMLFGILPDNPLRPFVEGNTLQIATMGILLGCGLLTVRGKTEQFKTVLQQAQNVVMRCVTIVCALLPVYICSSLILQFWNSGAEIFFSLWKPLLSGAVISLAFMACYLLVTCRKLRVPLPVLLPKLVPDYLIGLTTASAAAAFSATMEINEKKLGIEPSFGRTAQPIGGMIFAGAQSMIYMVSAVYLAQMYGVEVNVSWWITFWIASTLVTMASPPVAGGAISCLAVLMAQMQIPAQGLAIGATLIMFLDFIGTASRVLILHLEMLLQADRLGLLNEALLRKKL